MSSTSGSSGSEDTGFRFTLCVPGDASLGLEEEEGGGRVSGGESSRTEFDARLSVGTGADGDGSGFLIFLKSKKSDAMREESVARMLTY